MFSDLPEDDVVLQPSVFSDRLPKHHIHRVQPWKVSAISRSKPMRELRQYYYDLYARNLAEEDTEKPTND